MLIAQSRFETLKAVVYLQKFYHDSAHKLGVEFNDSHSYVERPFGGGCLQSSSNVLIFTVDSD